MTQLQLPTDPDVVGITYSPDGDVEEHYGWESIQNAVMHQGAIADIWKGDRYLSREQLQDGMDAERARYVDCWL